MQLENASVSAPLVADAPKEMLSLSTLEDGRTLVRINSSSLSLIQECPRKSWYVLDRKLKSNIESPATRYGSAIHRAMEIFYSGQREERKIPTNFEGEASVLLSTYKDAEHENLCLRAIAGFIEASEDLASLPPEDKRSQDTGIWTLCHYFRTYIDDPYVVLRDSNGPLVERRLTARLYDTKDLVIDYFGTVDVILQNRHNDNILVCDHKTSSVVGKDFYNRLKPNHQYTGYVFLAKEDLGLETDKFMVNCIEVKAKPKTARGSDPRFPRQVTTRADEDIQEFKDAVIDAVFRYLDWLNRPQWPIGNVNSCAMYGGCSFLEICSSPQVIRENIINIKYQER